MLSPTGWWLAVAPIDLRCGIDRLLGMIDRDFGRDVREGGAYVFRNRAGTRIKLVMVDAQGVWLCVRRLHEGAFHWPRAGEAMCTLTREQFAWLVAGVDWQRLSCDVRSLPKLV